MNGAYKLGRRDLFLAGLALPARAKPARLETLRDWMHAGRDVRQAGLEFCLERIKEKDPVIHAWVQVLPQKPTCAGELSDIPFGAKDIMETRSLATEYGSPVYKGRIRFC